ncbi:MAG: hypothetical protein HN390_10170 [Anaerolineae bacterium]|jgi:hypothetical protein|nr:hypothetical protein [Anaerolineae bacterium]MBT7191490.1 hypothetical protein [Anaerolineae bacterium]MBT7989897.1 hypothetical protein [Anaerolineae bacterium]
MKNNRIFFVSIVLLLGILLTACNLENPAGPVATESVATVVPATPVTDTTPPQVVMTDLPFLAFYNLGSCTPAPMLWKAQVTDAESAILDAKIVVRFSSEDTFHISSDYEHTLTPTGNGEYALSLQNSELDQLVAKEIFGTEKGLFMYRVVVADQAGNSQYYPSESTWAELSFLPCHENADIEKASGEVAGTSASTASMGAAATATPRSAANSAATATPGGAVNPCVINPNDPACTITVDICVTNPNDPSCLPTIDPCVLNPADPSCVTIDPCIANPSDPSCSVVPLDPCVMNPSDPACIVVSIDPCVANPSDPACIVVPLDPCVANPSDPACVVIPLDPPIILP